MRALLGDQAEAEGGERWVGGVRGGATALVDGPISTTEEPYPAVAPSLGPSAPLPPSSDHTCHFPFSSSPASFHL